MLEDVTKLMQLLIRNLGILQQFIIMTHATFDNTRCMAHFVKGPEC